MFDRIIGDKMQLGASSYMELVGYLTAEHTRSALKSLYGIFSIFHSVEAGNEYLAVRAVARKLNSDNGSRSEERRVGKECRSRF